MSPEREFRFNSSEQGRFDELLLKMKLAAAAESDGAMRGAALALVELGYDYCNERIDPREFSGD